MSYSIYDPREPYWDDEEFEEEEGEEENDAERTEEREAARGGDSSVETPAEKEDQTGEEGDDECPF